jgi:hypothetical protein
LNKFTALYVINKSAKKYQKDGTDRGRCRGRVLYKCKHKLINEWVDEFNKIEKHKIKSSYYYCLFLEDKSFHIPADKLDRDPEISDFRVLNNFRKYSYNEENCSERMAIEYLYDKHDINPNSYVGRDASAGTKWGYLPANFTEF